MLCTTSTTVGDVVVEDADWVICPSFDPTIVVLLIVSGDDMDTSRVLLDIAKDVGADVVMLDDVSVAAGVVKRIVLDV